MKNHKEAFENPNPTCFITEVKERMAVFEMSCWININPSFG